MSIFDIGVSGLLTNQAAISSTSHNIANANVDGYSRQRVSQEGRLPQFSGGNYIGTGVQIGNIERIYEASQQLQLQSSTADFYAFESYLTEAVRVDGLLADSDNGINNAIQGFFTALQGVANDPASIPARQVMLNETELMVSRFDQIHTQLDSQITEVNSKIAAIASEISALAANIAQLNNDITTSGAEASSDLLDQRDIEINSLSQLISVQTLAQDDGTVSVFVGTGQTLVIGSNASTLSASSDPLDPRRMTINITAGNSSTDITNAISGGEIGGLYDVVEEVIEPGFNTLGRVAMALSDALNSQNSLGMNLNNDLGGNFFTDINDSVIEASRVSDSSNNTGTAVLSITIDDLSVLGDSNYQLYQSGGNYTLYDLTTETTISTFAAPVAPATMAFASEGFTVNFISGAAIDGDSFKLQPTRDFASDFDILITSPEEIAAASPIRAEKNLANIGSGSISGITVSDTTTAIFTTTPNDLTPPIRIEFDATVGDFSIYDMTTGTPVLLAGGISGFVPGQDNDMLSLAGAPFNAYGYEITIGGDPQAGDNFDINYNNNGGGNNANISLMGDVQFAANLDNGSSNLQQAFGRVISLVGVKTQSAQINRDAAESLLFQAKERKESTSGVNLDEEAANLIKFQQAYEASAQVISVARTIFQTVLDSIR